MNIRYSKLLNCIFTILLLNVTIKANAQYTKFTAAELNIFKQYQTPGYMVNRVTKTTYTASGKEARETYYVQENGKIKFSNEDRYFYNQLDTLYKMERYNEIPDEESKELNTATFFRDKNGYAYLTIITVNNDQRDSIFTTYTLDEKGKNLLMIEDVTKRCVKEDCYSKKVETKFYRWNENNDLLSEISIEKGDTTIIETNEYFPNGKLLKKVIDNREFEFRETYEYTYNAKGLLEEEVNYKSVEPDLKITTKYFYDDKKRLIKELQYNNGKLDYSYLTTYNAKGQKIKYTMKGENGNVGIWHYQYDAKGRLQYKIDVNNIKGIEPIEVMETQTGVAKYEQPAPPPVAAPEPKMYIEDVDEVAEFPNNGINGFRQFFADQFNNDLMKQSQRFWVSFIVEKDGYLTYKDSDIKDEAILKEVKRILARSPKWKPGIKNGEPVRSLYRLPFRFVVM